METTTFPHEMGHFLYLFHTHENKTHLPDSVAKGENVTRDTLSACYNANFSGDLVVDTQADNDITNNLVSCNPPSWNYLGYDSCGEQYAPLPYNIMSYGICRESFTDEQMLRMRWALKEYYPAFGNQHTIRVTNVNVVNNENLGGTININGLTVESGAVVFGLSGEEVNLRENTPLINTSKFKSWDNNQSTKINESFSLITGPYQAVFHPAVSAEISARVDGGAIVEFEFKDPWYIDESMNQNQDYRTIIGEANPGTEEYSQYGGVFRNIPSNYYLRFPVNYSINASGYAGTANFRSFSIDSADFTPAIQNGLFSGEVRFHENSTINATYKAKNLSDDAYDYENTSQVKVTKTSNGYYHKVYESIGSAWYEVSSDGGINWEIKNEGVPLSTESKSPAIHTTIGTLGNYVLITYQEKAPDGSINIITRLFNDDGTVDETNGEIDQKYLPKVADNIDLFYDEWNAHPNCTFVFPRYLVVGWILPEATQIPANDGLYYRVARFDDYFNDYAWWTNANILIHGYDREFSNLTLGSAHCPEYYQAGYPGVNENCIHFAWQNNTSEILYCRLQRLNETFSLITDPVKFIDGVEVASSGSGYPINKKPSITVLNDGLPRLVWIGSTDETPLKAMVEVDNESRLVLRGRPSTGWNQAFSKFGYGVKEGMIMSNLEDNITLTGGYVVAYSNSANQKSYVTNTSFTIRPLSSIGLGTQLCASDERVGIKLFSKYSITGGSAPYSFFFQNCNSANKEQALSMSTGREAIITKTDVSFSIVIGEISNDNNIVTFPEITEFTSYEHENEVLTSNTFTISESENVIFSMKSKISNSLTAAGIFDEDDYNSFKIHIIDSETEEILLVEEVAFYDKDNLVPAELNTYQIGYEGVEDREVKVRIVIEENINAGITVSEIRSNVEVVPKSGIPKTIKISSDEILNYVISNNYPNPFNPTTKIFYQLPATSKVLLRVYDVLGNEVEKLVNEIQQTGKYEVTFNASSLTSGVYFYTIDARGSDGSTFRSVNKMMLLK